jgi:ribonuclease kappa
MACLGPKCSIYYMLLSAWGVIMLVLMGIFFKVRCPALFEDIKLDEADWEHHNYSVSYIQEKYDDSAINCWIAAAIYFVLFIFAFIQQRLNARQSYEMS